FRIILPQAVRMVIPPLTNRTIAITKGTALASVVGVAEILGSAQSAMAFSGNPSPLTLGAIAYALLFLPVVGAGRWIERRVAIPGR
ncbi:MAG TPA: ABC transporter permease subunit, partial [Roseomonas sp.]